MVGELGLPPPEEPREPVELPEPPVELPELPDVSPPGTKGSHAVTLSESKTTHPRVQSMLNRDTGIGAEKPLRVLGEPVHAGREA